MSGLAYTGVVGERAAPQALAKRPFGFANDGVESRHGANRVFPDRGFSGQHDGVGPFIHGMRRVGDFGTGGPRLLAHRLEYLRGDDDGRTATVGRENESLLYRRQGLERQFDPEIAAGDHDAIGHLENLVHLLDGLRLFDLRDDWHVGRARRGGRGFGCADVVGRLHEAQRHDVDAHRDARAQVLHVLRRERRRPQSRAWDVDSLVRLQGSRPR